MTNNFRIELLECLKKRNHHECDIYARLVKSNNRLFELNTTLKHEINELKLHNQKLAQDNLDLLKGGSGGGSGGPGGGGGTGIPTEKLRALEEQLFKSKDEVIDLQKKLVDQSQQVILLSKQLKEKTDEIQIKDQRITEAENRIELLKSLNRDLDNKIANCEEMIKLWKDEKVESEMQYNCLMQKYDKLKEDYQSVLTASLRFREEQIEKVNRLNELEAERLHHKLKEEIEKASQEPVNINMNPTNMVSVAPLNNL